MRLFPALLSALTLSCGGVFAANVGAGFGESQWALSSARQAGSGGLAIEDPWREGSLLETSTVLLQPAMQWFGLGWQGGLNKNLRGGVDIFAFSAKDITQTVENSDGTYGGERGTVKTLDYGGRIVGQYTVMDAGGIRVAALGRASGMYQDLPGVSYSGAAAELGLQARKAILNDNRTLTGWILAGPLGKGGGRWYTGQFCVGASLLSASPKGLLGGAEGYSFGAEGSFLGEGLLNGGLGCIYWFGRPQSRGFTFFLRAGARVEQESISTFRPQGGLGVIWRGTGEFGLQFDYAAVSNGALGTFHYATIGIRLPPPPEIKKAPPPPAPIVVEKKKFDFPFYFYPKKGERAAVPITLKADTYVNATLMDLEGKVVKKLVQPGIATAGTHDVLWDGRVENGMYARFGVPYLIIITVGNETFEVRAIPLQEPCVGQDCEKEQ